MHKSLLVSWVFWCHVLQSFTLGRLQPLLFADVQIPCRRNRNPDPKRKRSKVHPAETGEKTVRVIMWCRHYRSLCRHQSGIYVHLTAPFVSRLVDMNHVVLNNSLEMTNHYNSSFSREIIKYIRFVTWFYFPLALSRCKLVLICHWEFILNRPYTCRY